MRTLAVALVALLCVAAFVAADEAERRPKHHRKHDGSSNLVGRRCDKGFIDVGSDQCCPKDHPTLIGGTCYADCPDGHDDMTLGSWVGCREMCEVGYQSSINTCANGILNSPKKDTAREGVSPTGAKALTDVSAPTVAVCPKHHVAVKQAGRGKFKYGGCCPKDLPLLLAGKCYGACEEGKESITIGDFVGCRARCPDGFDEHTNDCTKSGEDDRERGDFPRDHVRPVDRIIVATPKVEVDTTGCDSGWMRASKYYCCEQSHPVLIGLLCYDKCKSGYEDSGFGCRKACPEGWDSHTLTCGKGSVTTSREGYERAPHVSRLRKL